jgi:hypothetical protein
MDAGAHRHCGTAEAREVTDPDFQSIEVSIGICIVALFGLLWLLRRHDVSLGLPFAYLALLLLNHLPGAYVQLADDMFVAHRHEVAIGIHLTSIGAIFFVIGVWAARARTAGARAYTGPRTCEGFFRDDKPFWWFCLLGGLLVFFGLAPVRSLPTIGAIVYNGGAIWILGVLLGLRAAVRSRDRKWTLIWLGALSVYPIVILVTIGFLSYGTAAVIMVLSALAVSGRSYWRIVVTIVLTIYVMLSVFSNWFQTRDAFRATLWSGASFDQRIDAASKVFTQFKPFDGTDQLVLVGFDIRLNQNYFIGLAAENINNGSVKYLRGTSVTDSLLALIPRVLWPEKTVFGGSPEIVSKMTGLWLNSNTSWGVGNVMEFYINFGVSGVIGGFLILGWLLGRLDHRAALAETKDDYASTVLFFLPAVALIQPLGSMVELTGGAGTAWLAALFWNWVWKRWSNRHRVQPSLPGREAPL